MLAINHALTGSLIGLSVGQPAVAIPIAFVSHFICDAIPHFGSAAPVWSRRFKAMLGTDALVCILLVVLLAIVQPVHWQLAAVCAFVAASPDFLWVRKFIYGNRHKRESLTLSRIDRFLGSEGIQWFQRPIGGLVEAAWFLGAATILAVYLRA